MSQRPEAPSSPETPKTSTPEPRTAEPQAAQPPGEPGCFTRDVELPEPKRTPPVQSPEVPGAYARTPTRKTRAPRRHGLEGPPPGCGRAAATWW